MSSDIIHWFGRWIHELGIWIQEFLNLWFWIHKGIELGFWIHEFIELGFWIGVWFLDWGQKQFELPVKNKFIFQTFGDVWHFHFEALEMETGAEMVETLSRKREGATSLQELPLSRVIPGICPEMLLNSEKKSRFR